MTKTLNDTVLRNLIVERELCIAKITFATQRLEKLEDMIEKQRKVVERETSNGNKS